MEVIKKLTNLNGRCMEKCTSDELFEVSVTAKKIVDCTILDAIEEIAKTGDCLITKDCPGCETQVLHEISQSDWPTADLMTVRDGLRCVKNTMREWKAEQAMRGWKWYTEFIGMGSDDSSDFYNYQVRWSVPTAAYPEPQVIVSVFFTVEAPRMKNSNSPVNVTYVFEGNQFAHTLKMRFRPKWIYDVLDIKTMIFKSLKF